MDQVPFPKDASEDFLGTCRERWIAGRAPYTHAVRGLGHANEQLEAAFNATGRPAGAYVRAIWDARAAVDKATKELERVKAALTEDFNATPTGTI